MVIYNGKHCVFEMVGCESSSRIWNGSNNVDNDNAYNDWNISKMRTLELPSKLLLLSSALQDNLTATTIQTAKNGISSTLVSTSDKLFLAAEKEMTASPSRAITEESNALTTWSYWTTHTSQSDRIKYDTGSNEQTYWLRSPRSGNNNNTISVNFYGNFDYNNAAGIQRVSLCYAF